MSSKIGIVPKRVGDRDRRLLVWARVHPSTLDHLLSLEEKNLGRAIDKLVENSKENEGRLQAAGALKKGPSR